MAKKEETNLHIGHRKREKERYLKEGLESFHDHEVLELLLFFAIPYKDTNNLAHELLQKYGALSGVLEADYHDLLHMRGIGENAATLLSLLPAVCRRYQIDKYGDRVLLTTTEELGNYVTNLFIGYNYEVFYLICLDTQNRVINAARIHEGTINEVAVYPRIVVETAIRNKAKSVIMAHNHPGGSLRPTASDMELTGKIVDVLRDISIPVIDHIIVSNGKYFSFAEKGLLSFCNNK